MAVLQSTKLCEPASMQSFVYRISFLLMLFLTIIKFILISKHPVSNHSRVKRIPLKYATNKILVDRVW